MARESVVDEFIARLQEAEREGRADRLAGIFEKRAELVNLTSHAGPPGADPKVFFSRYLSAFAEIHSDFTRTIDDGRLAVLEWRATGALSMGVPVDYRGISIIEYQDNKITKFTTCYDSAALLPHAKRSEKTLSESVGKPEITNQATS